MNLGAFAIIMRTGRMLRDLSGIGRNHIALGVAMVIFLLSLVGIPPLAGFVGKFLLFAAAIESGFIWLVVIAILNSVLSLAVYLRMIVPMYQQNDQGLELKFMPLITTVWVLSLIFTIGIGLAAQALLGRIG